MIAMCRFAEFVISLSLFTAAVQIHAGSTYEIREVNADVEHRCGFDVDRSKNTLDLYVPNILRDGKPCHIKAEHPLAHCDENGCVIDTSDRKSNLAALKIKFACVPKTAPTEFTNPPPDWKIYPIKTQNISGSYTFFDNLRDSALNNEMAVKTLTFCLFGKDVSSQLCGEAEVFVFSDDKKNDLSRHVLNFLEKIQLINDLSGAP